MCPHLVRLAVFVRCALRMNCCARWRLEGKVVGPASDTVAVNSLHWSATAVLQCQYLLGRLLCLAKEYCCSILDELMLLSVSKQLLGSPSPFRLMSAALTQQKIFWLPVYIGQYRRLLHTREPVANFPTEAPYDKNSARSSDPPSLPLRVGGGRASKGCLVGCVQTQSGRRRPCHGSVRPFSALAS
jgi:hypothetical protein